MVVHAGRRRWTAPGAAAGVAVSDDGEVLTLVSEPYAALDVRRLHPEHLPPENAVATLFVLNRAAAPEDAEAPLQEVAGWLPKLGAAGESLPGAYGEWLSTTDPELFPPAETAALVARLTGTEVQEAEMTMVLVDRFRRQKRRSRRAGRAEGMAKGMERGMKRGMDRGMAHERDLLRRLALRKFDAATASRLATLLAGVSDSDRLAEAGEWIIDCATGDELIERFGATRPLAPSPRDSA